MTVESQKGIIIIQWCSVENQKGAITKSMVIQAWDFSADFDIPEFAGGGGGILFIFFFFK